MRIEMDVRGAEELGDDLTDVPAEKLPEFQKVVAKGAVNIKRDLRKDAKSNGSYQHFHRSIDYDLGHLEAEIGPNKARVQGSLGNILYFGTSKNAPQLNLMGPLAREEPRFVRALGDVAEDIL